MEMTPERLTGFVQGVLIVATIWLYKEAITQEIRDYRGCRGLWRRENEKSPSGNGLGHK